MFSPTSNKPTLILCLLWLIGWTLRVPILAAPPLATQIADAFGLGEAGTGALTTLPMIAVAFGAIPAAWFISRFSLKTVIVSGLLIMAMASIARGIGPSSLMLFIVSVIMGAGVALFQTALPKATTVWTPAHVGLASAVYINGMMMGEMMAAGFTLPIIMPLADHNWRVALGLWSVPVIVIAALVAVVRTPTTETQSDQASMKNSSSAQALPNLTDKHIWQLSLLLTASIVGFVVTNAYAGTFLRARGEEYALKWLILGFNSMPLLASFIVLSAPAWVGLRTPVAVSALVSLLGMLGFVFLQGWASWVSVLCVGCASTVKLILLMSLPPSIAKGNAVTRLTAGMTLIGFSFTFVLILVGGWLADLNQWIEMAFVPSILFMLCALGALGSSARFRNYQ